MVRQGRWEAPHWEDRVCVDSCDTQIDGEVEYASEPKEIGRRLLEAVVQSTRKTMAKLTMHAHPHWY